MKSDDVFKGYKENTVFNQNTVISEKCNYIPIYCDVCGGGIPQKSRSSIIETNIIPKPEVKPIEIEHFDCDCHTPDHTIRFVYTPAEDGWKPELYIEVQLCKTKNIFQRIWAAIKYICGYECRYGHWDNTMIESKDLKRLSDLVTKTYVEYCIFMNGKKE